jgi:copper chaperone CopZ
MQKRKSLIVILATISVIFGMTLYALTKNPPTEQEHEHGNEETEEEITFLEQTFANIDPSVAKNLVLKVEEMDHRGPADDIANALVQYESSIGRVTADLKQKIFTIEYDSAKLKEEDILQTIKATGYKIEKISEEVPAPQR